ncbi:protease inhibitor I42 family protein, partial [Candidatus Omnitrophota bacterium]
MVYLKGNNIIRLLMGAALSIIMTVTFSGCGDSGDVSVLVKSDKEITVVSGKILKIELESNPTTGYSWEIAGFAGSDVLGRTGKYEYKPDSDRVGSGGVQIFKFKAKEKGSAKIIFEYRRPWEKNIEPV